MRLFFTLILSLFLSFAIGVEAQDADSLLSIGHSYSSQAEYETAVSYYQQAMELYEQEKNTSKWVEASIEYGEALISKGEVKRGLELFLELNNSTFEQLPLELQIRIKNNLGWAYRSSQKPLLARRYYFQGLPLAEKVQDTLLLGRLNNNISYTYQETGEYEKALQHQQKALEFYQALNDNDSQLAYVYNAIFLTLMDLGLYEQAEPYIRKSLAYRENIGNPNMLDVGYHNMAWNFEKRGIRDSSIIYYQKSLKLSRMLDNPYDITQTLVNIGSLYQNSGNFNNALAYYGEALEINRKINRPVSIAENLLYIADTATEQDDLDNAESFYKEALKYLVSAEAPRVLGNAFLKLTELEIMKGNLEAAQSYLSKLDAVSQEHELQKYLVSSRYLKGQIELMKGNVHASLNYYRSAYNLSNSQSISGQITAARNLAKAYQKVGSDSAFVFAEKAFTLIDSIRTNVAGLTFRSGFFRDHARFYNEVASWYITQKNDAVKAFELIEAAKARVLMDELAQKQERKYNQLDESTLIRKQEKAKQIDLLYNKLSKSESTAERTDIRNELKDLEFEYQTFINELHSNSPGLHKFTYPSPISAEQAQALLDSETAILEYAFTDEKLVRVLVTQDSIKGTVLDSVQNTPAIDFFTEKIKLFRELITSGSPIPEIHGLGHQLYQSLLPNFPNEQISNLVVVNEGATSFLPFEALSKNGRYLIEDYNIKYLPSASIYEYISDPHRTSNTELLALAGSGFESGDGLTNTARSQTALASLPSTLLEVDSIAVNFSSSKILKNEDVTEATFKSHNLSDFRFIHFATHATVDEITPSQSGIILSKKADVESLFGEDGHLNSREISDLSLNADLVTLSACNTGMGKVVSGEGLLGLQRSFLSAGASSVVVSLWSIFDRSTSEFMSTFYRNLLSLQEENYGYWEKTLDWFGMYQYPVFDYKTEALRDTKLAMINHPYYSHPVHWAPFILIGK
ncbi:CHAT domain-containing protein [Gracilimonas sp.]|uniref:CHAT domain-containing protein n=1 Tax=Gracilimonas sp. TaxID=1974203 RepID=UPI00287217EA|nr:CHAT domain-containing protein [Gracilimonas sp.]